MEFDTEEVVGFFNSSRGNRSVEGCSSHVLSITSQGQTTRG